MLVKIFEQLFASRSRANALKLFFMNPDAEFTLERAAKSAQLGRRQFRGEVGRMLKVGLIGTRVAKRVVELAKKRGRRAKSVRPKIKVVRERVYFVNKTFAFYPELRNLVLRVAPSVQGSMAEKVKGLGDIKVAILSGVFLKIDSSPADFVLAGDKLKRDRVSSFIKKVQADVGRELNYSIMTTSEFRYRLEVNDRFLREVLEAPHEKLINKLGI